MTSITQGTYQGLKSLVVENDHIAVVLLPEVGGKTISLVDKHTGREYLARSGREIRPASYDNAFEDYDISGFDECFPTVQKCVYPESPWQGHIIPDHGELWMVPWTYDIQSDRLGLTANGVRFPYQFAKEITVKENTVYTTYRLKNHSPCAFKYVWAAHPLFAPNAGMKILLPGHPPMKIVGAKHDRFGKGPHMATWPMAQQADGQTVDMSAIQPAIAQRSTKMFALKLEQGWCGLEDPNPEVYLKMSFPIEKIPYVGLWINEGGWPDEGKPSYDVALEPTTGCHDALDAAAACGECGCVAGGAEASWYLQIEIGRKSRG